MSVARCGILHADGHLSDITTRELRPGDVEIDDEAPYEMGDRLILDLKNPRRVIPDVVARVSRAKGVLEDAAISLEQKRAAAERLGLKDAAARYATETVAALAAIDALKGG